MPILRAGPLALAVGLGILLAGASCSSPRSTLPPVRELYRAAAQRPTRNPVVVVHGILGARLHERSTGRTVWGAFTGDGIAPGTPEGARALALPLDPSRRAAEYDPRQEDVVATGPLSALQLNVLFAVFEVDVYADILRALGVGGYSDPVLVDPGAPAYAQDHYTCSTFFYDWRRDIVANALEFGRFLREQRREIERRARRRIEMLGAEPGTAAQHERVELERWLADGFRFDVVAHSMGALLVRYYLRYGARDLPPDGTPPEVTWAGAEEIDRLIAVGTPNLGAMESLRTLVEGFTPHFLLPHFDAALLGTMPAIYQLLPRNVPGLFVDEAHRPVDLDLFDVATWERNGWGLFAPRSDRYLTWLLPDVADRGRRRALAREHVAWCLARARAFHEALDGDAPPGPAEIRLFTSDTIPTLARAQLRRDADGSLRPIFVGDSLRVPGDGIVARYSAIGDRAFGREEGGWLDSPVHWSSVTFLPDDHIGLTKNPVFTDNLLFHLLAQRPRPRGDAAR